MKKKFVEIVINIRLNEEVRLDLGNAELVVRRSRTITRTIVAETDTLGIGVLITAESFKLIESFDTLDFRAVENGLVGENESGSLKVEMHYRELQVVGLVLA